MGKRQKANYMAGKLHRPCVIPCRAEDSDATIFGAETAISRQHTPPLRGELEFPENATSWMVTAAGIESTCRDEFYFPSTDELQFGSMDQVLEMRRRILESGIDPRPERVFDGDDRRRIADTLDADHPWARQVCSLIITTCTGRVARGTGWFASPRTIVTAGHNLYFHEHDGWAQVVRVIPARNGRRAPFGSFHVTASDLLTTKGWGRGEIESDYGAIRVPAEYSRRYSSQIGNLGMRVADDNFISDVQANVVGYPVDVLPTGTLWWHGRRLVSSSSPRTLRYNIDTSRGQSGSPVYVKAGNDRDVIGIHNYDFDSFNQATRISTEVFNTITEWIEANEEHEGN